MKANNQNSAEQKAMLTSSELAWHYTTGENFYRIMKIGLLLPSALYLDPGESPVLWFSKNQVWEPTSRKMVLQNDNTFRVLSKGETAQIGGGLVRFGYPSKYLLDWKVLPKLANICFAKVCSLEAVGRNQGANPSDWMGCISSMEVTNLFIDVMVKGECWNRIRAPQQ